MKGLPSSRPGRTAAASAASGRVLRCQATVPHPQITLGGRPRRGESPAVADPGRPLRACGASVLGRPQTQRRRGAAGACCRCPPRGATMAALPLAAPVWAPGLPPARRVAPLHACTRPVPLRCRPFQPRSLQPPRPPRRAANRPRAVAADRGSQLRFIQHKEEAFWFYRFLSIVYDHIGTGVSGVGSC